MIRPWRARAAGFRFVLRADKELSGRPAVGELTDKFLPPLTGRAVTRAGRPRAIVQKALIRSERSPEGKRPKDMAYLYQVLVLFRKILPPCVRDGP
jgi:hypothetical protein